MARYRALDVDRDRELVVDRDRGLDMDRDRELDTGSDKVLDVDRDRELLNVKVVTHFIYVIIHIE